MTRSGLSGTLDRDTTGGLFIAIDSHTAALLAGVELVGRLFEVRRLRRERAPEEAIAAELATWQKARDEWAADLVEAETAGVRMPILWLQRRYSLSDGELDVVLALLAPLIDPEFLDAFASSRTSSLLRGLDVELLLGLLYHSRAERFAGRELLMPHGRLMSNHLIRLVPIADESSPHDVEVRLVDSLANLLLDRPLLSGLVSQFCDVLPPGHQWDQVILPEDDKKRVWDLISGESTLAAHLEQWGYTDVLTSGSGVVLLFAGPPGVGKTALAHAVAARADRPLIVARTSRLAATREPLLNVLQEIFQVAILLEAIVLLDDCELLLDKRDARYLAFLEALSAHDGVLVLTTNLAPKIDFAMERRITLRVDFEPPPALLREQIWEVHLPPDAPLSDEIDIEALADKYEFTGAAIRRSVLLALSQLLADEAETLTMERLSAAADSQLRANFDGLAIKTGAEAPSLDRLILPDEQRESLEEVLSACRHHEDVMMRWGFGRRLTTGRGICVLFDGPPGTGKTFCAGILAAELGRPLYRIHIPDILSKWLGETERNLSEIFVRARAGRAILLFDEADSLFGRRVQNATTANDRHANIETNLLLQEIERYDGVTLLTTNLFGNLDDALQRRIQFRVTFPFPGADERARIWQILLPPQAPVDPDVDFARLGTRYELAGGHIKNALLRAAYRARREGDRITGTHLQDAAIAELRAQGKLVRAAGAPPPEKKAADV